jgi:hypothetical protein
VAENCAFPATGETPYGSSECATPASDQWDFMGFANGVSLARPAGTVWGLVNGIGTILRLAQEGFVVTGAQVLATGRGCPREGRLGDSFRGWECDSSPPTRRWRKEGELDSSSEVPAIKQVQNREALGLSKGCDLNSML